MSHYAPIAATALAVALIFVGAWPAAVASLGAAIGLEAWRVGLPQSFWRGVVRNPDYVAYTPIVTTILLEAANFFQLFEMWTTGTAEGQSPWGWICINAALILWLNFYQVRTPGEKWAIRAAVLGIFINATVIATTLILK